MRKTLAEIIRKIKRMETTSVDKDEILKVSNELDELILKVSNY